MLVEKEGCGLELDAFVESEIVQPLKVYMSGMYPTVFNYFVLYIKSCSN